MSKVFKTSMSLRNKDDADPAISKPLTQAEESMGMLPNMYRAMVNLPALLDSYNHSYNLFRTESCLSPVEQEVVLLAISRFNGCHYCVAAHSFIADKMSKVPAEVTNAIREGHPIAVAKLEALRKFAHVMTESRGSPTPEQAQAFLDAGYSEKHILSIILALSAKVISNYSNHIFHTEVDSAFASRAWTPAV